jgi:hypothetical protein
MNPDSIENSPLRPSSSPRARYSIPKLQDSGESESLTNSFDDANRLLPQLSRIKGDVQDKPLPDHRTGKAPQIDSRRAQLPGNHSRESFGILTLHSQGMEAIGRGEPYFRGGLQLGIPL